MRDMPSIAIVEHAKRLARLDIEAVPAFELGRTANVLLEGARILLRVGPLAEALTLAGVGRVVARKAGSMKLDADGLFVQAQAEALSGARDAAETNLSAALATFRALGCLEEEADCIEVMAPLHVRDDPEMVFGELAKAAEIRRKLGDPAGEHGVYMRSQSRGGYRRRVGLS